MKTKTRMGGVTAALLLLLAPESSGAADPVWAGRADMPTARAAFGVGVVGATVFTVGGGSSFGVLGTVEAYQTRTNSWVTRATMPTWRSRMATATIGATLYVIGGLYAGTALNTVEAYNTATNTWTTLPVAPTARYDMAAAVIGGTIYVIGGHDQTNTLLATVEAYHPASGVWTTLASLPLARADLAAIAAGGMVLAVGGSTTLAAVTAGVDQYDPAADAWAPRAPMPTARERLALAAGDGLIFAIGGDTGALADVVASVEAWDPYTDVWTVKSPLATPRTMPGAAGVGCTLYAMGGSGPGLVIVPANEAGSLPCLPPLAASIGMSATMVCPGQNLLVTMTVSNTGSHPATGVSGGALTSTGTGGLVLAGGPTPSSTVAIPAGAAVTFTWTYTGSSPGSVRLSTTVTGSDAFTGEPLSLWTSSTVMSVRPPGLLSAVVVVSVTASIGGAVQVWLTVTNTGCAEVTGITPAIAAGPGAALVAQTGGPQPAGVASLPPGARVTFTWTFDVLGAGVVTFTATAAGTDALTAGPVAVSATRTIISTTTPTTLCWSARAPLPVASDGVGVAVIGGTVYVVGGVVGLPVMRAYDPATDSWTNLATMPTYRSNAGTARLGGTIYVAGGWTGADTAAMEAYDSVTDTWSVRAPMPTPRHFTGAAGVNGKIYVIGGYSGGAVATVEAYDPASNTWATRTPMPSPRYGVGVVAHNNRIYVIGGYAPGGNRNTVESYDPATDTWQTHTPMPNARYRVATAVLNGMIYVAGGMGPGGIKNLVEIYDPALDVWSEGTPMPTPRDGPGAGAAMGAVFVIGGGNGLGTFYAANERATPCAWLGVAVSATPSPVIAGQVLTVIAAATNSGSALITAVIPVLGLTAGAGLMAPRSGPSPATVASLPAGATAAFTWTFNVVAPGTAGFTVTVSGTDSATGGTLAAEGMTTAVAEPAPPPEPGFVGVALDRNVFTPGQGESVLARIRPKNGEPVRVRILTASGRLVRTLRSGALVASDHYEIRWDGRTEDEALVARGVYLVRIDGGGFSEVLKIVVQ